jgi:DNA-directed RNA polymerase specialized sigma24 family protein
MVVLTGPMPDGRQVPRGEKLHALEQAIRRDNRRHLGFAVQRVGIVAVAEDIVQNSYIKAVERIDQLRDPARAGYWLFSIVGTTLLSERRSAARWRQVPYEDGMRYASIDCLEHCIAREYLRSAQAVVEGYCEARPEAAEAGLRHIMGERAREVAEEFGMPISTVRTHAHRIRTMFRAY